MIYNGAYFPSKFVNSTRAGNETLELLEEIFLQPDIRNLMFVGGVRPPTAAHCRSFQVRLIRFDGSKWEWNAKKIETEKLTGAVVDMVIDKIKLLSKDCQKVSSYFVGQLKLGYFSCISNRVHMDPRKIE